MKYGPLEGTPEEIRDFTENLGLDFESLFQIPEPEEKLAARWILIPTIWALLIMVVLPLASLDPAQRLIGFLLGCAGLVWSSVSVYLRWGGWPTAIVAIGGALILFVAASYMGPKEALDAVKGLTG